MMKVSSPVLQLRVLIKGRPAQEYHRDDNTFIEGVRGANFSLELRNMTARRLLTHPVIDGLSVMTGEPAASKDSSHGYVLAPYATQVISGWRLNNQDVAQFYFAGAGKSYAEKMRKGEKGVIACAVWEEQPPVFLPYVPTTVTVIEKTYTTLPILRSAPGVDRHTGSPSEWIYCNTAASPEQPTNADLGTVANHGTVANLGTGFGEQHAEPVVTVTFHTSTVDPICVAVIYYDDREGLRHRGVRIPEQQCSPALPNPFPGDAGCTPPKDWAGSRRRR